MSKKAKFKILFGIDLDWFTRDATGEFDLQWFRCWLGMPPEGVESRCHRMFGPEATQFMLSLVPAEEIPVFATKQPLQSIVRVQGRTRA